MLISLNFKPVNKFNIMLSMFNRLEKRGHIRLLDVKNGSVDIQILNDFVVVMGKVAEIVIICGRF